MGLSFQAAIFDMDGVVTRTAGLHAAAWKETFDDLLRRQVHDGAPSRSFDEEADYRAYVDGKPRREGVRSFLQSRGIVVGDDEQAALASRKDALFEKRLREQGVGTFASTVALIEALRARGVKTAVVTSSRHGRQILQAAGIVPLFDVRLDGIDLDELSLKGKPDPDMFLRSALLLRTAPGRALVFEDAVAGVQAGHRGGFGLVVGIDRGGAAAALARSGADLVVRDLAELDPDRLESAYLARLDQVTWTIEQEGFESTRERQMESLFSIGNGYMGVRGALDLPPPGSQSDLFVAGVYDRKSAEASYSEIEFLSPDRGDDRYVELVPLPFPFRLAVVVGGESLDFDGPRVHELRRALDLRAGVLRIESAHETSEGRRTAVRSRRCASLADRHLLLQEATVHPDNHWAPVTLEASLDVPQLATHHPHLERIEHRCGSDVELVRYRTRGSGLEICIASRVERRPLSLRRLLAVFTSRDGPDPGGAALAHVRALTFEDFDALFAASAARWADFWAKADVLVGGRPAVEQALRFASYHLRLPAGDDPRVSIGARTLTGRAYEGHVFWDAEIFMLPFFLHTEPALARNLLLYRHHTLDGATRRARELGYRGACYAWESTVTGDDETPRTILLRSTGQEIPVFTGSQQVHVTADIAYAVWRYWDATLDEAFLDGYGAAILYQTARFWASRMTRGERHLHIRGVVGPDEYHFSVNDNAYTNWMARFNLERAAWAAERAACNLQEAQEWSGLAASLYVPAPGADGVIEQFEGFFGLGKFALADADRFKAPVSRLFDWEAINRLKILKQADVLMLPLLFPEAFSDEVVAANYRYYEPLTDHGSSLSPPVHAAIAARIGLAEDAERYLRQSLWLDLSNAMDNSMLGVHPAAMGGTWQALVFGVLGVRFGAAGAQVDAHAAQRLPPGWNGLELALAYRGRTQRVKVERP